ncbi:MAG: phosphate ABC transporter permease subunit PstC [Anaerolineales bacterium]|nr:phosphate ABC transporter permease subunit PstC [Anaerolineales bacterium]
MQASRNWKESFITAGIKIAGYSAILFVGVIFIFLITEGLPAIFQVSLKDLVKVRWYPIEDYFGLLPLIGGSIIVTLGAALIAVPTGIGTAIYISEVGPRWAREVLKPFVEIMAGIPSVVLGFIGILVLVPYIRGITNLPTGLSALTGSLLLAAISIPTIVSVAEDALDAVPRAYRDAALALGATRWQTIWRVTLPAARSGVLTAVMLGIGRAIGQTMAVMMITGNAAVMPTGLSALFSPTRTLTATIAAEMGEVATGSTHYHVLFLIGIVLFLFSLVINAIASAVIFRQKKRAERILS